MCVKAEVMTLHVETCPKRGNTEPLCLSRPSCETDFKHACVDPDVGEECLCCL